MSHTQIRRIIESEARALRASLTDQTIELVTSKIASYPGLTWDNVDTIVNQAVKYLMGR